MDREVIEQKLESLRRCLQRVANKCPPDPEVLGRDPDLQDIFIKLQVTMGERLIPATLASLREPFEVWPTSTQTNQRFALLP